MDWLMEDRIARNQATFRAANERIGAAAGLYDVRTPVPFICECADPTCSEVVLLELDRYEEIRADSRRFLNVPGHQTAAQGVSVVVEERNGYVIVEKMGHAGEVAEALDERDAAEDFDQAAFRGVGDAAMEERERRIGLNEALFREANERIREVNEAFATLTEELMLVCECGHGTCAEQISMKPGEYQALRAQPADFAIVPGHEIPDVEEVIARGEEFAVVRKKEGIPRRVAEVTDPR